MGFRYTPYESRYANTIGELLLRQGDIGARQAEAVAGAQSRALEVSGAANARAAEQRGAAWSGALSNIGQTVAAIPGQMQEAKQRGVRDQADLVRLRSGQMDLNDRARDNATSASRAAAMRSGGRAAVLKALENDPQGYELAQKHFDALDTSLKRVLGTAAAGVRAFKDSPQAAIAALDDLVEQGYDEKRMDKIRMQIVERPESVTELVNSLLSQSPDKEHHELVSKAPKAPEPFTLGEGQRRFSPDGTVIASVPKPTPEIKTPTIGSFEDYVGRYAKDKGVDPATLTPTQIEDARKRYLQSDDRPRITVNTGANANVPGDWDKSGDDFLQTIPAQWRRTVEKIAKYDEDPTKVASMRGGMRETLMQWVNQVNPAYDSSQFSNRAPTRKAFTTGTQGQQINAINTAIGHIDQIIDVGGQMQNGDFTPVNALFNKLRTVFGSDKVTNFDTLKEALAGEVASVLSKGGATVSGIEAAKQSIKGSSSPQQLAGYVKTLVPVMGSKLAAFDYQYHQAMGEGDKYSALSPESKRILEKHGFDPAHPTVVPSNAPTLAPSQTHLVIQNGVTYEVTTDASGKVISSKAKS